MNNATNINTPRIDRIGVENEDWRDQLHYSIHGKIKTNRHNAYVILSNHPRLRKRIAFDEFSCRIVKIGELPWDTNEQNWSDIDDLQVANWTAQQLDCDFPTHTICEAIQLVAHDQRFHPVRDYLEDLSWDGVSRLNEWLFDALDAVGGEDPILRQYIQFVGRKALVGAVARVMSPGCKVDHVLILEGEQGIGKSTAIQILAGEWHADTPFTLGSKDAYQGLLGKWIIELAELDALNRSESSRAKAFFSSPSDNFRPSYGRRNQDFKRQCIFIGSTNSHEYLRDQTGNRRYWPVLCRRLNADFLLETRDKLFAEAKHRYDSGEAWWPAHTDEREMLVHIQSTRELVDPWRAIIEDWLAHPKNSAKTSFTMNDFLVGALNLSPNQIDPNRTPVRVGQILSALGFRRRQSTSRAERAKQRYFYERHLPTNLDNRASR